MAVAAPAAADPPTEFPILDVFEDVNPCTGDVMTVTFIGAFFVHEHDSTPSFVAKGRLRRAMVSLATGRTLSSITAKPSFSDKPTS